MWTCTIENIVLRTGREQANHIHQGTLIVFDLPFRISSGKDAHFKDIFDGHTADIWVLNKIPSYSYPSINEPYRSLPPHKDLMSRFTIFIKAKLLDENSLRDTALAWEEKRDPTFPKLELTYVAMKIFERFMIALKSTSNNCISSPIGDLYQGKTLEMFQWICLKYNVIVIGSSPIPGETIWKLSFRERRIHVASGWSGTLDDISDTEKDKIQLFLSDHLDNNFYYDLRYRALQMAKGQDWRSALLWEVIALETLINMFYDYWIDDLSNDRQTNLNDESALWSKVSKDIGLTNLIQLIPYLINSDKQCPSEEITKKVVAAIKIRNKLTHSLKTKDGEYHTRIIDNSKLNEARKSVIEFSEGLLKIVGNRPKHK